MEEFELVNSRLGDKTLENRGGMLHIGGCSAADLAEKYGTPLYVYDEDRIRSNYRRVVSAFRKHTPDFQAYYAVKANNNPAILRILESEGAGADASGPDEIRLALEAGFGRERILYSGNYHTDDELKYAVHSGLKINLDSVEQMERIVSMNLRPDFISFRINPGIGSSGHEGLVFAGPDVKFGVPEREAVAAYNLAKKHGIKKFGVHMMTGSNILDPSYFEAVTLKLMDIVGGIASEAGINIEFVDIGGGLGVPYRPEDRTLDIDETARTVSQAFKKKTEEHALGRTALMMEPGRYFLADAGVLLAKVHSIKDSGKLFIGTDAGMNTLLRPALFYSAYHPVLLANRLDSNPKREATVVGQVCENTDHLARDRALPEIRRGDILAVANAGAYGFAMSSQYNTRPRPAEVLVSRGRHDLIRKRETFEDLCRNVLVPPRLSR